MQLALSVTFADGTSRVVALDRDNDLGRRRLDKLAFMFLRRGEVDRCAVHAVSEGRGRHAVR